MSKQNNPIVEFVGKHILDATEGTIVVRSDSDYVALCEQLAALQVHRAWIRMPNHYQWVIAYCQRMVIEADFSKKTPRTLLASSWNVSPPDWLTDEMVMADDLLKWPKPAKSGTSFGDAVLTHLLGEDMAVIDLIPRAVVGILASISEKMVWQSVSEWTLLKNCIQDKCDAWKRKSLTAWEIGFADGLAEAPVALWRDMTILALLRNYPSKHMDYLLSRERSEALAKIPDAALIGYPLQPNAVELVVAQVEMFFADNMPLVKSSGDLQTIVACLSGRLAKEFQQLEQLLGSSDVAGLSNDDMEEIKRRFKDCEGLTNTRLDSLDKFLKAARPECLNDVLSWGAEEWLKWSTEKYFSFRQWQTMTGTPDDGVEGMVQAFSDWYINEYTAVHQDSSLSLVHVLTGWQSAINADELSLVVVADCVPVDFWRSLKACLVRKGFIAHETGFRFSPLPTHTAVSKPMMIAGQWDAQTKPYHQLLGVRSEADWADRKVKYCADLKALTDCELKREATVLLLNFLPTDDILHSDVARINSTYEEEAQRVFARLAEGLSDVVGKWPGPLDRIGLYVVTDHGATRVLPSETKTLDSKVVSRLFADSKHRYAEMTDADAGNIPQNLWALGYRFRQPFSAISPIYFIPKGHNTVAAGAEQPGYKHGGATPEEVIVPVGVFRLIKPAWKSPVARFLDIRTEAGTAVIYVQRLLTISIAVQNPNAQLMRIKDVRILTPGGEVRKCSRPTIAARSEGQVKLECLFHQDCRNYSELGLEIEFIIAEHDGAMGLIMKATFKSAQAGGFQLKELT